MNVRDRISRLELLLQKIQSHTRARRNPRPTAATPAEVNARTAEPSFVTAPAPVLELVPQPVSEEPPPLDGFEDEAPTSAVELVDVAPIEALSEEDVFEMDSDVLESVPPSGGVTSSPMAPPVLPELLEDPASLEADLQAELEPPASSKRHRISGLVEDSMAFPESESLGFAEPDSLGLDEGREIPVKTPPPESGPQEAPAQQMAFTSPAPVDVEQLLGDLPPVEEALYQTGPSPEQLGQTIELEDAIGPTLELDAAIASQSPAPIQEELEVTLPLGEYAGKYDESLVLPPEARDELAEHRRKSYDALSTTAASEVPLSAAPTSDVQVESPEAEAERPQEVRVRRSPISGTSPVAVSAPSSIVPARTTFLELLDDSLRLGS